MFITEKSFWKIIGMMLIYAYLGSLCLLLWASSAMLDFSDTFFLVVGVLCLLAIPLIFLWGWRAEGKGRYLALGNKLIRVKLKPREFIRECEALMTSETLVYKKPCMEIFYLLLVAHDLLDEEERVLFYAEEIIRSAPKKKKATARLIKADVLFGQGRFDEGEALFVDVQREKMSLTCRAFADAIYKSDRARALGDYQTVETWNLTNLSQAFPKPDALTMLICHERLAEVYEKMGDKEKAIVHYEYCAAHGGETAITEKARTALLALK